MSSPIYEPFDEPDSEAPAARFLMMILLDAIKPGMERIHFERIHDTNSGESRFVVSYEKNGDFIEKATPPFEMWHKVISRLKLIAHIVENDPEKSDDGHFSLRLSKNRVADYQINSVPDPAADTKVTLVHRGTRETPVREEPERSIRDIEEAMQHFFDDIPEDAIVLEAPIVISISTDEDIDPDELRANIEQQNPGAKIYVKTGANSKKKPN